MADTSAEAELRRPAHDAPVRVWVTWLNQHAELCDVIAAESDLPDLVSDAMWMADRQRRLAKELQEKYQPDDTWPDAPT